MNNWLQRRGFLLWCATVSLSVLVIATRLYSGVSVETDIRALLPDARHGDVVEQWLQQVQQASLNQTVVLIGHADRTQLPPAMKAAQAKISQDGVFTLNTFSGATDAAVPAIYLQHRYQLLAQRDQQDLLTLSPEQLATQAEQRLYGLGSISSRTSFAQDPFGYLAHYLDEFPALSNFTPAPECLMREHEGVYWCLMVLQTQANGFDVNQMAKNVQALDAMQAAVLAATPAAMVLDGGISRHAHVAATQAKSEIALISFGSLAGIVLLLGLLLRRIEPFLLTVVAIAVGSACGLAACLVIYSELHLIALVFGACLIGVAVDYALHFFTATGTGRRRLEQVLPGMSLGCLTTSLAFLGLLIAPYPSLRQVAVFAVAGLVGACLSVVGLFPQFQPRRLGHASEKLLHGIAMKWPADRRYRNAVVAMMGMVALLAGASALSLNAGESVRAMHYSAPELLSRETQTRQILGGLDATQSVVIVAPTMERLLQASAMLDNVLAELETSGVLARHMSISQVLPSQQAQQSSYQLLADKIYAPGGALDLLATRLGLPMEWVARERNAFASAPVMTYRRWVHSPNAELYKTMTLESPEHTASLVRLGGVSNMPAVQSRIHQFSEELSAAGVQVSWRDPLAEASHALNQARHRATQVLLIAGLVVLGFLALRYGVAGMLVVSAPTVLALLVCLASLSLQSALFSLFRLFALLLVMGMAIDYAIFLRESTAHPEASVLAILMSAATTILAFGLLALSSTPALHEFGSTVVVGVSAAVVATLLIYRGGLLTRLTTPPVRP